MAFIAATYVLFFLSGSLFPHGNNIFHVPIVLDYFHSTEGPHDQFHQSLRYFASAFWLALRPFATEANVVSIFLDVAVGGYMLSVTGFALLVRAVRPERLGLALALVLLLAALPALGQETRLGGGELWTRLATHSTWATGACLMTLALHVGGWKRSAGLLLGVAAAINLFLAFWTGLAIGLVELWSQRHSPNREGLKALLGGFAGTALLASLPTLLWTVLAQAHVPQAPFSFTAFLWDYYPYHWYATAQGRVAFEFAGLFSLVALVGAIRPLDGRTRLLLDLMLASGLCLLLGGVVVYLTDDRLVLNLHPLRFASIVTFLQLAVLVALFQAKDDLALHQKSLLFAAAISFGSGDPKLGMLALVLLLALRGSRGFAGLGGVLLGAGLVWSCFDPPTDIFARLLPGPLVGWLMLVVIALGWRERPLPERLGVIALFGALVAFDALLAPPFDMLRLALGLAAMLVLAAIAGLFPRALTAPPFLIAAMAGLAIFGGMIQGARQGFGFANADADRDWIAAQAWARTHSPPDTLFWAPYNDGFAVLSRRPVWWDWKSGATVMWYPAFHAQWDARQTQWRALKQQGASAPDLLRFARNHGIRFVVIPIARLTPGTQAVFSNGSFAILAVR